MVNNITATTEAEYEDTLKKCATEHPVTGVGVLVIKTINDKQYVLTGKRLSHPGTGKFQIQHNRAVVGTEEGGH